MIKRLLLLWMLCAASLLLAGCGSQGQAAGVTTTPTSVPLAVDGPPCRLNYSLPYHDIRTTCTELVYDNVTAPEAAPALTGLAFGPDGTLYLARTAYGEIWAMRDGNGDGLMDEPRLIADGLRLPTGITLLDGALYVRTATGITRLDDLGDPPAQHTVLVDDLDLDSGTWMGSVGIGPDGRLYTSVGARCATCTDERRGVILSYELDGSGERIEASGLSSAADFAWGPSTGDLWILDGDQVLTANGNAIPLPDQSRPTGLTFYMHDGFPSWQGDLLVALGGSWDRPEPAGYALDVISFDGAAPDGTRGRVAPVADPPFAAYSLAEFSLNGMGFFPYHPADVVISPDGWIYVSLEEGRIYRFRPRPKEHIVESQ